MQHQSVTVKTFKSSCTCILKNNLKLIYVDRHLVCTNVHRDGTLNYTGKPSFLCSARKYSSLPSFSHLEIEQ